MSCGFLLIQFTQDSDLEKDKDEPAAPGSSKAKKKKKKKKKAEEAGSAAQVKLRPQTHTICKHCSNKFINEQCIID